MEKNKMFGERKFSKKAIIKFFDNKGFFVVLFICLLAVGATSFFVARHNAPQGEGNYDIDNIITGDLAEGIVSTNEQDGTELAVEDSVVLNEMEDDITLASSTVGVSSSEETTEAGTEVMEASTGTGATEQLAETNVGSISTGHQELGDEDIPVFAMPVYGEIITEFAIDKLVYSKTLEEWRTHSGIDLAASRGTAVKVVADGVVSEIKNDPRYGITVVVEHQDGLKTVYSNLASDDVVLPNQRVKKGDIIGSVGNTAVFESMDQSHLHFEVLRDNVPVNPMAFLPDVSNFTK